MYGGTLPREALQSHRSTELHESAVGNRLGRPDLHWAREMFGSNVAAKIIKGTLDMGCGQGLGIKACGNTWLPEVCGMKGRKPSLEAQEHSDLIDTFNAREKT